MESRRKRVEDHENQLQTLRVQDAEEYNMVKIKLETDVQVGCLAIWITLENKELLYTTGKLKESWILGLALRVSVGDDCVHWHVSQTRADESKVDYTCICSYSILYESSLD